MGSKKGPMETFRVVLNGGGEAPQPRGVGVVVSVEDVLGALVKADDPIKRDRWSATAVFGHPEGCLLYTSPSPRDKRQSRMPSSA